MESKDSVFIFINIFLFATIIFLYFYSVSDAKKNITAFLQKRGATDINVYHEWFDFDRDTLTFTVTYVSYLGNKLTARCKLQILFASVSEDIFWSETHSLEFLQPNQKTSGAKHSNPNAKLSEYGKKILSKSKKKFPTYEISMTLAVPNSDHKIVMLNYSTAFRNILRCKPDGSIKWQAELPTPSNDVYTDIAWKDGKLTAFSRSCISVVFDVETGKILSS